MEFRYIQFASKQSLADYKLGISEANIGYPNKAKNRVKIPNTNIYYDYAQVYGDLYEERELSYTFLIMKQDAMTEREMESMKAEVANWLVPGYQHKLIDSAVPNYYFLAEVQSAPEWEQVDNGYGTFKVKFTAYPYKIRIKDEFDDDWDTFEFETDVAQNLGITVNGVQQVDIYNAGLANVYPELVVTGGDIQVTANGVTNTYRPGTHSNNLLQLIKGNNNVVLYGNGRIEFHFHKEVL